GEARWAASTPGAARDSQLPGTRLRGSRRPMHRSVIESLQAPKAIGPYSQAIAVPATRMVFLSGQIPLDPATGELVPGDASAQTAQVMKNLGAVLHAAGGSFDHVVRCTIYRVDLSD